MRKCVREVRTDCRDDGNGIVVEDERAARACEPSRAFLLGGRLSRCWTVGNCLPNQRSTALKAVLGAHCAILFFCLTFASCSFAGKRFLSQNNNVKFGLYSSHCC